MSNFYGIKPVLSCTETEIPKLFHLERKCYTVRTTSQQTEWFIQKVVASENEQGSFFLILVMELIRTLLLTRGIS